MFESEDSIRKSRMTVNAFSRIYKYLLWNDLYCTIKAFIYHLTMTGMIVAFRVGTC